MAATVANRSSLLTTRVASAMAVRPSRPSRRHDEKIVGSARPLHVTPPMRDSVEQEMRGHPRNEGRGRTSPQCPPDQRPREHMVSDEHGATLSEERPTDGATSTHFPSTGHIVRQRLLQVKGAGHGIRWKRHGTTQTTPRGVSSLWLEGRGGCGATP